MEIQTLEVDLDKLVLLRNKLIIYEISIWGCEIITFLHDSKHS